MIKIIAVITNYTRQTRAITAIIPLVKLVVLLNNTTRQTRGIIPVISLLAIRLLYIINKDCSVKNIVYKIDCLICIQFYLGETERTAHDRLGEHLRYAKYPNTPSNKNEALAIHYATEHPGCEPNLKFSVLTIEPNTVRRKIFEALVISSMKPSLNLKEELKTVQRFLTHRARV